MEGNWKGVTKIERELVRGFWNWKGIGKRILKLEGNGGIQIDIFGEVDDWEIAHLGSYNLVRGKITQ